MKRWKKLPAAVKKKTDAFAILQQEEIKCNCRNRIIFPIPLSARLYGKSKDSGCIFPPGVL